MKVKTVQAALKFRILASVFSMLSPTGDLKIELMTLSRVLW